MADEIKIAEVKAGAVHGDTVVVDIKNMVGQTLDASATQDDSEAINSDAEVLRIYNSHTADVNLALWDTIGAVDVTNSMTIKAGEVIDIKAATGWFLSSKIV